MGSPTPMMRTLKELRDRGYTCGIVERFVRGADFMMRKDFLGFADIIAIKGDETLAIQVCGKDFAEHMQKLQENENVPIWKAGKNRRVEIWGWRKILREDKKFKVWVPRVEEV